MAERARIEGEEIQLCGELYTLPPLPLIKMAKVGKLMQGGDALADEEYVESLVNAIHWSLERNYPEIARTVVEEGLDMTNFQPIMDAFMSVNGFTKKQAQPGESQASQ